MNSIFYFIFFVRSHKTLLSAALADGSSNATPIYCDNNLYNQHAPVEPTDALSAPAPSLHVEDSNSNSNMVIDESCTTTHSSIVNPFKELDERWRLEQQTQNQSETNNFPARNNSPVEPKLIVPKFKLRVPKEFQKSVDVALSSTDSEPDDDDEENEEAYSEFAGQGQPTSVKNRYNVGNTTPSLHNESSNIENNSVTETTLSQRRTDGENSQESCSVDKEEWVDGPSLNLERILQEIERTKLDIQRTKETLHHAPKARPDLPCQPLDTSAQSTRNWTPTPPISPKQMRCPTPLEIQNDTADTSDEQLKLEQQQQLPNIKSLHRKDSAGSDAMDIDETITGSTPQEPPRYNVTASVFISYI